MSSLGVGATNFETVHQPGKNDVSGHTYPICKGCGKNYIGRCLVGSNAFFWYLSNLQGLWKDVHRE
ncbi:hypothetical protein HAX54_026800, partial [Datura stramonium]|nr:hypothetical protein [Datura stramonium]